MKAIVSSLYLAKTLEKVLKNKGFNEIVFNKNCWILNRSEKPDVILDIHYTKDSGNDMEFVKIDRVQCYKLLEFLRLLPEQPIVIEIIDYGNEDIKIQLTQFVANF